MGVYNPIRSVTPVAEDGSVLGPAVTSLPAPANDDGYVWGLKDISAKYAGRSEALVMNKARKGQARTLKLAWRAIHLPVCSQILQAFNAEYVQVEFLDPMEGGWITKTFYVGDRNAPSYNSALGLWKSVEFTLIQRDAS